MAAIQCTPIERMSGSAIKPKQYLDWARRDALLNNERGYIAAIKNAKCAIDAQLDVILEFYGLLSFSQKKHWPFPQKVEVIRQIGVVSPQILIQVNNQRNLLEHSHRPPPERQKILDSIDIAELFIAAIRIGAQKIAFKIDHDSNYAIVMDYKNEQIRIYDNTELILKSGGAHMFEETLQEHAIQPVKVIDASNLEAWIEACQKYLREF